jgi:hypothetical protein
MRFKDLNTDQVAVVPQVRFYWSSRGTYVHSWPPEECVWYVGEACRSFSTEDFPVDGNGDLPIDILIDCLDTAHIRSRNYAF